MINTVDSNQQPVIGIFTQSITDLDFEKHQNQLYNKKTYIMASYTKYLEGQGARIVPLIITDSDEVNLAKIDKLNGVLFPGSPLGRNGKPGGGDYYELGKKVMEKVRKINDNGQFYPLWGT